MATSSEETRPGLLGRLFWGNGGMEGAAPRTWSMGVLNPVDTVEVPGSLNPHKRLCYGHDRLTTFTRLCSPVGRAEPTSWAA
jgi:hypothetical protein